MRVKKCGLAVIGAGPGGLAAALAAHEAGVKDIVVFERGSRAGGILPQCIHNGFGLHYFKKELTGPEYAQRFIDKISGTDIDVRMNTTVLSLENGADGLVVYSSSRDGYTQYRPSAVLLATGCRERTRGHIQMPGSRPSGIMTAGTAQRYINIEGYMVGKKVVILGSGDIGLIMARRLTLEGAEVSAVAEIMPHSSGLARNIAQCLDDFNIPLLLSHTVTDVRGDERLCGVTLCPVNERLEPIKEKAFDVECDTLLLSVGLIPENELTRAAGIAMDARTGGALVDQDMQTSVPGIFSCGNALMVHDLVDFVSLQGEQAGKAAARFIAQNKRDEKTALVEAGMGVGSVAPQLIRLGRENEKIQLLYRVNRVFGRCRAVLMHGEAELAVQKMDRAVPGESCELTVASIALTGVADADNLELLVEEL